MNITIHLNRKSYCTPATSVISSFIIGVSFPLNREQLCKHVIARLISPPLVLTSSLNISSPTNNFSSSDIKRNLKLYNHL